MPFIKRSGNPHAENRRIWIVLFLALAVVILPPLFPVRRKSVTTYAPIHRSEDAPVSFEGGGLLIDINRAEAKLLMELPGIGARRAEEILKYREQNGGFLSIEEILNVPLMTQKVYDDIKARIRVAME